MKYTLFLILLTTSSIKSYCIDDQGKSKIILGAKVYYDRSGNTSISPLKADMINYGLDIQLPVSKHFRIQTGVYKITKATVFSLDPNYYRNINLPVGLVYTNKLFYIMIGGYYDKLLEFIPQDYRYPYTSEFKNYNYGIYFGLGIEKPVSDKITFIADIREMWNLNNYDRGYSIGTNKTIGCSFGLQIKL